MDAPAAAERYLAGLTAANLAVLGEVPPLYESGVRWSLDDVAPLPLAHTIARRRRGACGPLAAWRAAELMAAGEDARVKVIPSPSGVAGRWHAVVERADGTIEDPSEILGLRSGGRRRNGYTVHGPSATAPSEAKLRLCVTREGHVYVCGVVVPFIGHSPYCIVGAPAVDRKSAAEFALKAARLLVENPALEGLTSARTKLALAAAEALATSADPDAFRAAWGGVATNLAAGVPDVAAQVAPAAVAALPGAAAAPGGLGSLVPTLLSLANSGQQGSSEAGGLLSLLQTQGPQALQAPGALGQLGQLGSMAPPPWGPAIAAASLVLNTPEGKKALNEAAGLLLDQVKFARDIQSGAVKYTKKIAKGIGHGLESLAKKLF